MSIGKAVVTGGAGFIGSNLVDRLIDEGTEVLVVDDLSSGTLSRLAAAGREVGSTSTKWTSARPNSARADRLRSRGGVSPCSADRRPVFGCRSCRRRIDQCTRHDQCPRGGRDAGVDRIIFASSGGATVGDTAVIPTPESVERKPESPYGVAKMIVDDYLGYFQRTAGLDYASLGFSNVYGPGQDPLGEAGVVAIFSSDLLGGRTPTIYGDGLQTRDYVFVEDVTDACWRAALMGGNRYFNIGTGIETTVVGLYERMARIVGSPARPNRAAARSGEQRRSCLDSSDHARPSDGSRGPAWTTAWSRRSTGSSRIPSAVSTSVRGVDVELGALVARTRTPRAASLAGRTAQRLVDTALDRVVEVFRPVVLEEP